MRFHPKYVQIDAEQYRVGQPLPRGAMRTRDDGAYVITMHGNTCPLKDGDWVIAEDDGVHFYPCDAVIFAKRWTPV